MFRAWFNFIEHDATVKKCKRFFEKFIKNLLKNIFLKPIPQ